MEEELEPLIPELVRRYRPQLAGLLTAVIVVSSAWAYGEWRVVSLKAELDHQRIRVGQLEEAIANNSVDNGAAALSDSGLVLDQVIAAQKESSVAKKSSPKAGISVIQSEAKAATTEEGPQASTLGKININTASITQLDSLPGIGPVYAQRIIDYRDQVGGFKSIEQIVNVKGIGPKTVEKIRDRITI